MANINSVVVSGNLTRDPETRALSGDNSVTNLRIASNARRKVNNEWVDVPNYFDVTVWGKHGESVANNLSKGDGIVVKGRLEWREWDAQDGTKRQGVAIVADDTQFIFKNRDGAPAKTSDPVQTQIPDDDDIPF